MISSQFIRFAIIGALGFLVDAGCLNICLSLGAGHFLGRLISYLCAASFTWFANRLWTFNRGSGSAIIQWAKFLLANSFGGAINYGVYSLLIKLANVFWQHPTLAVGCGSIAGLAVNFTLSKKFVFHRAKAETTSATSH